MRKKYFFLLPLFLFLFILLHVGEEHKWEEEDKQNTQQKNSQDMLLSSEPDPWKPGPSAKGKWEAGAAGGLSPQTDPPETVGPKGALADQGWTKGRTPFIWLAVRGSRRRHRDMEGRAQSGQGVTPAKGGTPCPDSARLGPPPGDIATFETAGQTMGSGKNGS